MPEIEPELFLKGDRATLFDNISAVKRQVAVLESEDKHFVKAIDNAIQQSGKAIDDTKKLADSVNTLGMQFETLTGEIRSVRDGMEMGLALIRQKMETLTTPAISTPSTKSSWFQQQFSSWKNPVPVLIFLAIVAITGREGVTYLIEIISK